MIVGIMDIGSNTVRLCVFKLKDGKATELFSEKDQLSLRSYIKDGCLSDKGIKRLYRILEKFKALLDNFDNIDGVYPFATATIRDVSNRQEILKLIEDRLGLKIEILSAEEEARLSFVGASVSFKLNEGVLTDIGGGSTELVIINQGKVIKSTSLSIGSLSAFNDYVDGLFAGKKSKKKIEKRIEGLLEDSPMYEEDYDLLAAVGGSARASLKFYKEYYGIEDSTTSMDQKKFDKMLRDVLKKPDRDKLDMILAVKPDRVHTLLPGMVILNKLGKFYKVSYINVSQTGVREGYVYSKLLGED